MPVYEFFSFFSGLSEAFPSIERVNEPLETEKDGT